MTTSRSWAERLYRDLVAKERMTEGTTNLPQLAAVFMGDPIYSLNSALLDVKRKRAVADAEAARHAKLQRLLEMPVGGFMVFDESELTHVQPHIMAAIRENFNVATDPQTLRVVITRVPAKSYVVR